MFSPDDFSHLEKMNNTMADGITDASDSHEMLEKVVEIMSQTDFSSDESRMRFMMYMINLCYEDDDGESVLVEDNVINLVLALCFNYSNVMSNLAEEGFDLDDYYNFLKTEVLPQMGEESKALPYWDVDEN